jgi:hypothetical protein
MALPWLGPAWGPRLKISRCAQKVTKREKMGTTKLKRKTDKNKETRKKKTNEKHKTMETHTNSLNKLYKNT